MGSGLKWEVVVRDPESPVCHSGGRDRTNLGEMSNHKAEQREAGPTLACYLVKERASEQRGTVLCAILGKNEPEGDGQRMERIRLCREEKSFTQGGGDRTERAHLGTGTCFPKRAVEP